MSENAYAVKKVVFFQKIQIFLREHLRPAVCRSIARVCESLSFTGGSCQGTKRERERGTALSGPAN